MVPRTLRVPAALLAFLTVLGAAERPRFQPKDGSKVRRTFESTLEMKLESSALTVNGEDWPSDEEPELELAQVDRYVVLDTYVRVVEGRPRELVRTFEELGATSSETYAGEKGEEQVKESALVGLEVRFAWDEGEERYTVKFKDDEGEAELLEDLEEDMDLRGFLPPREVSEGEAWDVDVATLTLALSPGGDLKLEGKDEDQQPDFGTQLDDHMEGEVRATARGTRTVDGRELMVIALSAQTQTWATAEMEAESSEDGPSGTVETRMELRFELEGELLWDLKAGRAHALALEGPLECDLKNSSSIDTGEETMELTQVMKLAGPYKLQSSFEAVE